jgi:hypothetical protein
MMKKVGKIRREKLTKRKNKSEKMRKKEEK